MQSTMARHLIANLDPDLIPHIKNIIVKNPVPVNVYELIKERLISGFAFSAETCLRQFLKGEVVSERKPFLLLFRLIAFNDGDCYEQILKSVFLEQLLPHVRVILAMSNVRVPTYAVSTHVKKTQRVVAIITGASALKRPNAHSLALGHQSHLRKTNEASAF